MIHRGFTYRLSPTPQQAETFSQVCGVCRYVYNLCLEQREKWWRQFKRHTGKALNFASQGTQVTELRSQVAWIQEVPCDCLHRALRDLDAAFAAFFKNGAGYPRYKKRGVDDKFRFPGARISWRKLNAKWGEIRLQKLGWIKFRKTRDLEGRIKNVTVYTKNGNWYVSVTCEIERDIPSPISETIGIDRGVSQTIALSTGEIFTLPDTLEKLEAKKRKAQRVASRRQRGSNRKRRAQARVSRLQAKQARIRRDFNHRIALDIAKRVGVAVLEDLKTSTMTASAKGTVTSPGRNVRQKAGLNRAILNASWRQFQSVLTYKIEERGGQVVTVRPEYTSQTCAVCGVIDARSRESQARFECVSCGHTAHADINAAINIERRWSTPLLDVEGLHKRPREASTLKDQISLEEPKLTLA